MNKNLTIILALVIFTTPFTSATALFTNVLITGNNSIFNTGTLIEANNLGNSSLPRIVNGVSFGNNESSLTGFQDSSNDDISNHVADADMDFILSTTQFVPGGGTGVVTVNGLVTGRDYRLQLLIANSLNGTGVNTSITVEGDTLDFVKLQNEARNIVVDFTASGTSVSATFNNTPNSSILNAYALHELNGAVPEPSSFALAFLAIGFCFFKRK